MSPDTPRPIPPDWDVVDRYLAGEATPDERSVVEGYLAQRPDVKPALKRLSSIYAEQHSESVDVATAWTTLVERLATATPARETSRPRKGRFRPTPPWYQRGSTAFGALAAALVVLAGVVFSLHRETTSAVPMTTYTTRNSQRADIKLADGSTVSLNVGSQLDVPANYAFGNHKLRLHGEALFTVVHHGNTPFEVVTGNTTVRVLGTSFVVRQYATDTAALVAVQDGKVAVGTAPLTALQRADVTRDGQIHVGQADPSLFAFATGTLVLDWTPLRDAIPELERWYDAHIVVTDPAMLTRPMKGAFAVGSMADLSQILSVTLHAHVVQDGRVLTIAPQ